VEEWPHLFIQQFTRNPSTGMMVHNNPAYRSFYTASERYVKRPATPPILMTRKVYDGFRVARPQAPELKGGWFKLVPIDIPDYAGEVYGGDVIYTVFRNN
jgi:hypothetical protein